MRIILVLILAFTTLPSLANERNILDLQFLPSEGDFASSTSLAFLYVSGTADDFDLKIRANSFVVTEQLSYSFTDNSHLSIGFGYGYTKSKYTSDDVPAFDNISNTSKGIDDVSISYTHRILDNNTDASNLDLSIGVSPKIGNNKIATEDEDGNALSGKNVVVLGVEWGLQKTKNHFSLGAGFTWNGETTSEVQGTNIKSKTKQNFEFDLTGTYQYDFNAKNALTGSVFLNFATREEDSDTGEIDTDTGLTPNLAVAYKHAFNEEFLVDAGIIYTRIKDDSDTFDTTTNVLAFVTSINLIF